MKNIFLILFLIPVFLYSQGWEKVYGYGTGNEVQQTTDGGYIVVGGGSVNSSYTGDVFIIKTNNNGDTLWTKTYGGLYYDTGRSIQQTTDGGYIITGLDQVPINKTSIGRVYLIKTDSDGDTIWTKKYFGTSYSEGKYVQQSSHGGYIVVGTGTDYNNNRDIYVIRTNDIGDTIWTKHYGGEYSDSGNSIQQTSDGNYVITGGTISNLFLMKIDDNGDTLWTMNYSGQHPIYGNYVQQTTDGGYIITGSEPVNSFSKNAVLIKTDENGNIAWVKTFDYKFSQTGNCVQQTSDGGFVIIGTTHSFVNEPEFAYLIKTDNYGDTLWTKTYGGEDEYSGYSIKQTNDGGYIFTGRGDTGSYIYLYLIKTDSNGTIVSITEIPRPNPVRKLLRIVDLSGRELTNPIANVPYIEIYNDGTTQKKISVE